MLVAGLLLALIFLACSTLVVHYSAAERYRVYDNLAKELLTRTHTYHAALTETYYYLVTEYPGPDAEHAAARELGYTVTAALNHHMPSGGTPLFIVKYPA